MITLVCPTLAVCCVIGAVVGLLGYFKLGASRPRSSMWRKAFLYFGCMNMDGLLYHCFIHKPASNVVPLLHCLDVMFTSLSSFHLMLAGLEDAKLLAPPLLLSSVGTLTIVGAALSGEYLKLAFVGEFLYIGVTIIAAAVLAVLLVAPPVFSMLLKGQPLPPSFIGLAVAVAGAGLFALAPLAEVLLCSYLDPSVSRHLAGVALAFFGCDVAFAGFLYYLTTALPNRDKKQI